MPGLDIILRKFDIDHYSTQNKLEFKSCLSQDIDVDLCEVEDMFQSVYGFPADKLRDIINKIPFDLIGPKGGLSVTHPLLERMLQVDGISSAEYSTNDTWMDANSQDAYGLAVVPM